VVASASGTQVTVSWTAAIDNIGVTGYRVDASATTGSASPPPMGLVAAYGFDEGSGATWETPRATAIPARSPRSPVHDGGIPVEYRRRVVLLLLAIAALSGGFLVVHDRLTMNPPVAEAVSAAAGSETSRRHPDVVIDQRRQQLIGIRTSRVTRGTLVRTIRATGTVRYDQTRLTDVNVKLEGWIADLYVNYIGQPVARGQALFTLFSNELLSVQNELLLGLRNRDQLTESQAANAREFGERVVNVPRQTLLRWDVPADVVGVLEETRQLQTPVEFRSPADGVVIDTAIVKGMHVEPGQTLYRLADLSVVWVEADFHELDRHAVRVGADADVTAEHCRVSASPGGSSTSIPT
jgi:hypothetical protein